MPSAQTLTRLRNSYKDGTHVQSMLNGALYRSLETMATETMDVWYGMSRRNRRRLQGAYDEGIYLKKIDSLRQEFDLGGSPQDDLARVSIDSEGEMGTPPEEHPLWTAAIAALSSGARCRSEPLRSKRKDGCML